MTKIIIRPYSHNDFSEISGLMNELQDYFVEIDSSNEKKKFESSNEASEYTRQAISDAQKLDGAFFVAVMNEEIVGFIQGVILNHEKEVLHTLTHHSAKEGWIGLFFVNELARAKGVGKKLLNSMQHFFTQRHCTSMRLKVAHENYLALQFYDKSGFKPREIELAITLVQ